MNYSLNNLNITFDTLRMIQQCFMFKLDTIKQLKALNLPDDFIVGITLSSAFKTGNLIQLYIDYGQYGPYQEYFFIYINDCLEKLNRL